MVSMKTTRPLAVDFDWLGGIPTNDRKPGESKGHHLFFLRCIHCDHWCDSHLLKCANEHEIVTLLGLYAKRLEGVLPFEMFPDDFTAIAKGTWNDAEYQAARAERATKNTAKASQ